MDVVDLVAAIIIGGAFGKIVDSLTQDIVMPVADKIFGDLDFSNYYPPLNYQEIHLTLPKAKKAGVVFS